MSELGPDTPSWCHLHAAQWDGCWSCREGALAGTGGLSGVAHRPRLVVPDSQDLQRAEQVWPCVDAAGLTYLPLHPLLSPASPGKGLPAGMARRQQRQGHPDLQSPQSTQEAGRCQVHLQDHGSKETSVDPSPGTRRQLGAPSHEQSCCPGKE